MATDTAQVFALASLSVPTPLLSVAGVVDHWVAVVNGVAGAFQAERVADELALRLGSALTLYPTPADPQRRVAELAELIQSKHPSLRQPLGILALGGDGTTADALKGIIRSLGLRLDELANRPHASLTDQLQTSGIQLGLVGLGGANDLAALAGAPSTHCEEILDYLTSSRLFALNMGLAFWGDDRVDLFAHVLSAGTTIAAVFEKTEDKRGMSKKRWQKVLGAWHILRTRPFKMRWREEDGPLREGAVVEMISHAIPRGGEDMGFPGTPQPGLGVKVFPDLGFWRRLRLVAELYQVGRACKRGNPEPVLPRGELRGLDASLQLSLAPGEEMVFSFYDLAGNATDVPVQANGESIGRTQRLRVHALTTFPAFMVRERSLLANLERRLP